MRLRARRRVLRWLRSAARSATRLETSTIGCPTPPFVRVAAADVGGRAHDTGMANIDIMEIRAFEPRCLDCGETGPIESSAFWAMAWEEAHVCVAARIDSEAVELTSVARLSA